MTNGKLALTDAVGQRREVAGYDRALPLLPRRPRAADDARAVPTRRVARPGRHGRGLPRLRHRAGPPGGVEAAAGGAVRGPRVPGSLPPGGQARVGADGPARRPDPPLRRDRRPALPRHAPGRGRRPRRGAAPRRSARPGGRGAARRAGGQRAGRRAPRGAGAPRRQALERLPHPSRVARRAALRLPRRLRDRPQPVRRRRGADRDGHRGGHTRLHGTRAVPRAPGGRPLRRLRAGVRAVRVPHRRAALRPGRDAVAHARAPHRAAPAAVPAPGRPARIRRGDRARDGEGPGAPAGERRRAGGAGPGRARPTVGARRAVHRRRHEPPGPGAAHAVVAHRHPGHRRPGRRHRGHRRPGRPRRARHRHRPRAPRRGTGSSEG
jgi:hypothetical protein